MPRTILAAILLLMLTSTAFARKSIAPLGIAQQLIQSDAVVVGKVTSIEKELSAVKSHPDAKELTEYTVAVVKVETAIRGVKNTTHLKVGFVRRAEPQNDQFFDEIPQRNLNLDENGEYLLILQKHSVGSFYIYTNSTPPQKLPAEPAVAEAKLAADAIADPMKALKFEKAQDRALAAMVLLMHYRQASSRSETVCVALDTDENTAILKAIAEGDWTVAITGYTTLSTAIQLLGIGDTDGWKYPAVKADENQNLVYQKAFQDWLAGAGAKFRFHKYVPKAK